MKTKLFLSLLSMIIMVNMVKAQQVKQITSTEAAKLLSANKNMVVLDVRTPEEFNAGHIKGAININIREDNAFAKIDKLNHNATYVVHCRTNHRSKTAVDHMVSSGFKDILQISDGFTGWSMNGLPVIK